MPFAAGLTTSADSLSALDELCAQTLAQLGGTPDLALLFFSPHHAQVAEEFGRQAQKRLTPRCLLGCPGEAIVGDDREVEQGPAMSLWLGRWSKPVDLTPFHLTLEQT